MSRGNTASTLTAFAAGLISLLALLLLSCSSSDEDGATAVNTVTAPGDAAASDGGSASDRPPLTAEECAAELGHPCRRTDVDPAILEEQARLVTEVAAMSVAESREAAFAWVEDQENVIDSHFSDTVLMFQLDGAMPTAIITPIAEPPPGFPENLNPTAWRSPAVAAPPQQLILASGALSSASPAVGEPDSFVVGAGTDRANPQNQKQALFLEPWASAEGSLFNSGRVEPRELLSDIPDYSGANAVLQVLDANADPFWFTREVWRQYDFIYVSTHAGTWEDGAVIESGVRELWDGTAASYQPVCDRLMEPYLDFSGLECGVQQLPDSQYITIDMTQAFFISQYFDPSSRLDRAVIYMEGCDTLAHPTLAEVITGESSAYLGWTSAINLTTARHASGQLLVQLTKRQRTVGTALETMCDLGQCGGERFREPGTSGEPFLKLHGNGGESERLRLYDIPVLRDPRVPTNLGPGLEDGASLQIEGTPGDGVNDQVEIAVDLVGVIDPDDTSTSPSDFTNIGLSQARRPADLYNLSFFLGDDEVSIGRDNLGRALDDRAASPPAVVIQLNEMTYRYIFTADLPFDVSPEGTDTSLKVVVELPEGGISDYSVDVTLVGGGENLAVVTIGGETWRFEGDALVQCRLSDDGSQLLAGGTVDGALKVWLSANLTQVGIGTGERLIAENLATIQLKDDFTHQTWRADPSGDSRLAAFAAIPGGASQIDSLTMEGSHAWGTATFIEMGAVGLAWSNHTPLPASVSGSFDVQCGSGRSAYGP